MTLKAARRFLFWVVRHFGAGARQISKHSRVVDAECEDTNVVAHIFGVEGISKLGKQ